MTLQEILSRAQKERWALPHFNVSDGVTLRAICDAAQNLRSPVLIGTSEGERDFIGMKQAVALVRTYREEYDLPVFLNADHSKSFETAKAAVDAGYDSIHIDLSALPLEENIKKTRELVKCARAKNKDISVEGEVGYLVTESSRIYKEAIDIPEESLAKPEDAGRFVKETGVDRLAPAVGTLHGIAANAKIIDFERVRAIRDAVGDAALVLHGGSGASDDQIREAIAAGISNIHINTEIRVAYIGAIRVFLSQNSEETTPYKIFWEGVKAVRAVIEAKIKLFGSENRI